MFPRSYSLRNVRSGEERGATAVFTGFKTPIPIYLAFFGQQRLGTEALNPQTGSLLPAAAREASYTFEQEGVFCGASYHGMWLNGQPHGQ